MRFDLSFENLVVHEKNREFTYPVVFLTYGHFGNLLIL